MQAKWKRLIIYRVGEFMAWKELTLMNLCLKAVHLSHEYGYILIMVIYNWADFSLFHCWNINSTRRCINQILYCVRFLFKLKVNGSFCPKWAMLFIQSRCITRWIQQATISFQLASHAQRDMVLGDSKSGSKSILNLSFASYNYCFM